MNPDMGGTSQAVRSIIPELNNLDLVNEVLCLDDPDSAFIKKDAFKIHAIGSSKGPWAFNKALLPWLLSNLSNYDVVIVHALWQYQGYAVNKALNKLRNIGKRVPKLFVMPHGMLDPYFQRAEGRKLKAIRNWVYWKFIESKLVNSANALFFTCEEEKLLARKPFRPYSPNNEFVVGLGIHTPPAYNSNMTEAFLRLCSKVQGKSYILFLSRIHEKKGVELLVKAFLKLQAEGETLPHLIIAGPGMQTTYGQQMQKLAEQCNYIHFPGMLSGDAKWGAFYGCETFVLPSHQENFGIAVVEALACSKPVLISDQVNIWREIESEKAGLVAPDSEDETYKLLKSWLGKSIEEKATMSENGLHSFRKHFAIEQAAKKMKVAFESILIQQ